MEANVLIPIVAIVVSGAVGLSGVLLNLRLRAERDTLERASRRTTALQMLSDEEFALQKVREECRGFMTLIDANEPRLQGSYQLLKESADRVVRESKELLSEVREKRRMTAERIDTMTASEIERVIAGAYHGRMLAEVQLYRTTLSKADTIRIYLGEDSQ